MALVEPYPNKYKSLQPSPLFIFLSRTLSPDFFFLHLEVLPPFYYLFIYLFGCTQGMWMFPGQGSNMHHSSDPSHSSDHTSSLTH